MFATARDHMVSLSGIPPRIVTEALAQTERRQPGAEGYLWEIVHGWILRIARTLLAHDDQRRWLTADDLVQETFLRVRPAYLRMTGLRRSDLQALVLRVMRQVLIDESRRHRTELLVEPDGVATDPDGREAVLRDLGERLERLARCRTVERRIVELHVFEEWTFAQIAAELGGSASWVRKRFHAALGMLGDR